eukprot:scaffold20571_cov111-Isochrysis_galbana.AAC.1
MSALRLSSSPPSRSPPGRYCSTSRAQQPTLFWARLRWGPAGAKARGTSNICCIIELQLLHSYRLCLEMSERRSLRPQRAGRPPRPPSWK